MTTLREHDVNILKSITFILIVFPFISHIFSAVFPILYNFEISYISILIIIFTAIIAILERHIVWHKDIMYFVPFLLVSLASSIYNYDLYFTKYVAYTIIYFYFLRRFFLQNYIFKLYVNILVITFLLLIIIYILAINFDLYTPFRVEHLEGLSLNSPMQNYNSRAQIFYLLVFDQFLILIFLLFFFLLSSYCQQYLCYLECQLLLL